VDYLLKPVDPARLARAIERLRRQRPAAARPAADRLVVSERGQLRVIACRDLLWLQAADNYVELHTAQRLHLLRRTLDGLLADLGPGFARIHRSRAVALAAVIAVEAAGHGNATVRLTDGTTLGCSRPWREALQRALAGRELDVGGHRVRLGEPHLRELLPHNTLYAHFVASDAADGDDERAFLAAVDAELDALGAACRRVCGRRQLIRGGVAPLGGFSLMLHGLAVAASLRVLEAGVGGHRRLGCGLFVPHRSAAAVGG